MDMITPYKHQQELLNLNPDRHLLNWGTRVGKTLASIWLANQKGRQFLVVTRKGLVQQWIDVCKEVSVEGFMVISKENFKKNWNNLQRFETFIADEVHDYLGPQKTNKKGNHTLARTFDFYLKRHNPRYRYYLSATPYCSTPWNIYNLAYFLGHSWNYHKFTKIYFKTKKLFVMGKMKEVLVKRNDDKIKLRMNRTIAKLGSTVKLEDCYDMPEQIHADIDLEMSREQKKAYENIIDINGSALRVYRHRVEVGHVAGDGYEEDVYLNSPINDSLIEYGREFKKLAIVCRFRTQIDHVASLFPERRVIKLWGGLKDFHASRVEAEELDDCVVIIQSDCSAGYSLASFEAMVFASCDYKAVNYEQIIGRIKHIGKTKKLLYFYPTTGDIGKRVLECVRNGMDFNP